MAVALEPQGDDVVERVVAEVRYASGGGACAEFAIAVADGWNGQGLARRLLALDPGESADRVAVRLDYLVAVARLGQEKPREGRQWAARAAASSRAIDDGHTLVRALLAIDFADQQLGRSGVGAHTREALQISMAIGDRPQESVARANLGVLAFYAGRWAEAVDWLTTSSRVAIEAGNDFGAAETDLSYADILIYQGRLDEAQEVLRNASRVLRASGIEDFAAHGQMVQARIHLARGELDLAEQQSVGAVAAFTALDSAVEAFEASLVRAEVAVTDGRPEDALRIVHEAYAAAHGEGAALEARRQLARGRALLDLGRFDEAASAIADGLAAAREQELPYDQARLLRLRSRWRAEVEGPAGTPAATADEAEAGRLLASLGAKI